LAFAVIEIGGGASGVGVVLASFTVSQVVFILFGGVWADRLPRNRVMVGADVGEGVVQLVAAFLILTGRAEVWHLAMLAACNGLGQAFFFPASQGIVPQVVSRDRLQEANALLRLSLNATGIGGAALAGLLVAAIGAGWAIAFDGLSFLLSAVVVARIALPETTLEPSRLLTDLREGWGAFSSRTWLWVIVLAFGFINAMWASGLNVLGPLVAQAELGGAAGWGLVVAATGAGFVAGGMLALRFRPRYPLRAGMIGIFAVAAPLIALAVGAPLPIIAACGFVSGVGVELFGILWELSLQQHIPQQLLSRVASYDMLGSIALMPVGYIIVGPLSDSLGIDPTLWVCATGIVALTIASLAIRDVWRLERQDTLGPTEPAVD
jgi:MFS family permease